MSEGTIAAHSPLVTAKSIKRQRFYLVVSSVSFSLWVIAMLIMYRTTVYPQRHPTTAATAQSVR